MVKNNIKATKKFRTQGSKAYNAEVCFYSNRSSH